MTSQLVPCSCTAPCAPRTSCFSQSQGQFLDDAWSDPTPSLLSDTNSYSSPCGLSPATLASLLFLKPASGLQPQRGLDTHQAPCSPSASCPDVLSQVRIIPDAAKRWSSTSRSQYRSRASPRSVRTSVTPAYGSQTLQLTLNFSVSCPFPQLLLLYASCSC